MHSVKDLHIWIKAIDLAADVYELTKTFPRTEQFGITNQMRRCSTSIAANISEGAGRNSSKDFLNFLSIANGSTYELETFIILANRFKFIDDENKSILLEKINHIIRMNYNLQNSIRNKNKIP
jgi:four helix bundle protein